MQLNLPFSIGSRLLPALRIGNGCLSLEWDHIDHENRDVYRYYLDIPAGEFTDADLRSGCGGNATTQSMFASLLAFLGAAAESYPDGENANLFPRPVVEWAAEHADEIGMLQCEIDETAELIID